MSDRPPAPEGSRSRTRVDHVALLVRSIERFIVASGLPRSTLDRVETFPSEGTRELYLSPDGNLGRLLLMQPLGDTPGPYARALASRGPGLHHVGVAVPELEAFVDGLSGTGWLLHPSSLSMARTIRQVWLARPGVGTLIEVMESPPGEADRPTSEVRDGADPRPWVDQLEIPAPGLADPPGGRPELADPGGDRPALADPRSGRPALDRLLEGLGLGAPSSGPEVAMTITDRPHARLRFAGRSLDLESLEIRETFRIERFDPARHGERLEALTRMLHRAYAPLAARGLRFVATHQDAEVTRQRLGQGEGFVGFLGDRLVATITLVHEDPSEPSAWYQRPDVSFLTQFAVDPDSQGHGLGNLLLDHVETLARARGSRHLALDTSEHAADLIDLYTRKGFATVETTRWEQTNYTSVVMSKPLGTP